MSNSAQFISDNRNVDYKSLCDAASMKLGFKLTKLNNTILTDIELCNLLLLEPNHDILGEIGYSGVPQQETLQTIGAIIQRVHGILDAVSLCPI